MRPTAIIATLLLLTGCGSAVNAPAPAPIMPVTAVQRVAPPAAAKQAAPAPAVSAPATTHLADAGAVATPVASATLEMLTFNTFGKPGLLGKDEKRRMQLIGPAISGYDVVAMQETFTRHSATMGKLSGFAHQQWFDNGSLFKLGSGLYTVSRHSILETDFARFEKAKTWDWFARKGVAFTRLDVPGVGPVDIYNTHYQSVAKYGEIREHDNSVLEALVKRHDAGHPTFLMGDFNMKPGSPEFQDLMRRLSPRDGFREANPDEPGYTSEPGNLYKKDDGAPKRIDYIFALPNADWDIRFDHAAVAMRELVDGVQLSDHYGVEARVTIRRK